MKLFLLNVLVFISLLGFAQQVETQLFIKEAGATGGRVGIRVRSTSGTLQYVGVTFYVLYQSANATPGTIDDSKLVNTFKWGSSTRFTNAAQVVNITAAGKTYDRRYIYGNVDENSGSNIIDLTTSWDTLVYIPFTFLSGGFPPGGFAYQQQTADAGGTALTDINFSNISIGVTTGSVALGGNATLPVHFVSFDAHCSSTATNLAWSTANEKDNAYFEVQKSTDGSNWNNIGRVNGAGNSNTVRNYRFADNAGGSAQYRVKQVDVDGTTAYTATVRTICDNSSSFYVNLYPVPARDKITLTVDFYKGVKTTVFVVDNNGRIVMNMPLMISKGINKFEINVSHLPQGQYYLQSASDEIKINQRFTIAR